MNHSRWSYISLGFSVMLAFSGALSHSLFALLAGLVLSVYNWYTAEHMRKMEDEALIAAYELIKEEKDTHE